MSPGCDPTTVFGHVIAAGSAGTAYGGRMRVLVSGGAGYIGSHTVLALVAAGHDVVVVNDFSNSKPSVQGRLEALSRAAPIPIHAFNLTDIDKTEALFAHDRSTPSSTSPGTRRWGSRWTKPLSTTATTWTPRSPW